MAEFYFSERPIIRGDRRRLHVVKTPTTHSGVFLFEQHFFYYDIVAYYPI